MNTNKLFPFIFIINTVNKQQPPAGLSINNANCNCPYWL